MVDRSEYSPVRDIYREGVMMDKQTKSVYGLQEKLAEKQFRKAQSRIMLNSKFDKSGNGKANKSAQKPLKQPHKINTNQADEIAVNGPYINQDEILN